MTQNAIVLSGRNGEDFRVPRAAWEALTRRDLGLLPPPARGPVWRATEQDALLGALLLAAERDRHARGERSWYGRAEAACPGFFAGEGVGGLIDFFQRCEGFTASGAKAARSSD